MGEKHACIDVLRAGDDTLENDGKRETRSKKIVTGWDGRKGMLCVGLYGKCREVGEKAVRVGC